MKALTMEQFEELMEWDWHDELDYRGEIAEAIRALIRERDDLLKAEKMAYINGHVDDWNYRGEMK